LADRIYAMETHHRETIRKKFKKALGATAVFTFGICDDYEFMPPELVALLKERLPRSQCGE